MMLFKELEKAILKFISKHKRPHIVKVILSKKSNAGGITIPHFELYFRAIVTKKACYCQNRYGDK
jgi:hypothetical protein